MNMPNGPEDPVVGKGRPMSRRPGGTQASLREAVSQGLGFEGAWAVAGCDGGKAAQAWLSATVHRAVPWGFFGH